MQKITKKKAVKVKGPKKAPASQRRAKKAFLNSTKSAKFTEFVELELTVAKQAKSIRQIKKELRELRNWSASHRHGRSS